MSQTPHTGYIPALRFNWLTPYYDLIVGKTLRERTIKNALILQANIKSDQHVLDLACGTGTLTLWAKQSQPNAVIRGVDGDPAILEIARHKVKKANLFISFDCALSYLLPYPDTCFDTVISSLFFHHLTWKDKQRTASELFRVLKPGAELHIADWGYPANIFMRGLFLSIQCLDGFTTTRDNADGKLVRLFQECGFLSVIETNTFNTIYGTMRLVRAEKPG